MPGIVPVEEADERESQVCWSGSQDGVSGDVGAVAGPPLVQDETARCAVVIPANRSLPPCGFRLSNNLVLTLRSLVSSKINLGFND